MSADSNDPGFSADEAALLASVLDEIIPPSAMEGSPAQDNSASPATSRRPCRRRPSSGR